MQSHWEKNLLALAGDQPHLPRRPVVSYWAADASLGAAYRQCAIITARHSKSFHLASQLLPEPKRQAVRALYAFCRTVDDVVDASDAGDRADQLDRWRELCKYDACPPDDDAVAVAWTDTLARCHIPRHYAIQLIDGVARDLTTRRYETFEDLSMYCYGVASTVGLMSMYIVGFQSREAIPYAIKLGVALQMTNILRDVGEDYRNGRVYLPREEMRSFGIDEADLSSGRVNPGWREFMRFQIERTRSLYAESEPGISMLDPDGQLAIAAAADLYRGILDVIERNDYDVFSSRASLSAWEKLRRIPRLFFQTHRLSRQGARA
ncbi:MAG TPA: phytoene/squalene synthase family protein [Anaerolineales bacterium]|nr:phytoene/squalene synthase family protein [Anaerolineales bacterium]